MNKKLLATVLASTMVLGSVSAYAAAEPSTEASTLLSGEVGTISGQTITVETKMEPVLINVEVPTKISILFNPYEVDGLGQILSPINTIENKGGTAVKAMLTTWKINITSADTKNPVTLATAPVVQKTSAKKEAFMILQTDQGGPDGIKPWDPLTSGKDKNVVVPAKDSAVPVKYGTLENVLGTAKTMKIQFQGNMSTNVVWEKTDTITAIPTFKFEPTVVTP